jgi:predicted nucleic acid-binding protein
VAALLDRWLDEGESLFSPSLWEYEATTAIRKYAVQQSATPERTERAMRTLDDLPLQSIPTDPDLRRAALAWAKRLGHHAAYDGFYVALAERLETELWTADRRLANGCAALGVEFVQRVG